MSEDLNPDGTREPYFRQTLAGTSWHPISQESMTQEPVASLTVMEQNLGDWQDEWWTINQEGFDEDVQPAPGDEPPTFDPLVVTASSGDYITVHDFVSAVHPWLMERRREILLAMNVADEGYTPPTDPRLPILLVSFDRPEEVSAKNEDDWMRTLRRTFEEMRERRQQQQQEETTAV